MRVTNSILFTGLLTALTLPVIAADQLQTTSLADIKWSPCDSTNAQDPCQASYFRGNPKKEPNHSYFRVPKGYSFEPHWHKTNSYIVVLNGVFAIGAEGDSKGTPLRVGDYAYVAANWVHWLMCEVGECVAYYYVDGPSSYIDVKDKRP